MVAKLVPKKGCEKMDNNSSLEQALLVFNRNAELLHLVGRAFDSKAASLSRLRKKNLNILQIIFNKTTWPAIFWLSLLTFSSQIPIENVRKILICSLNVSISVFIEQMAFIAINAIKVLVWTRYKTGVAKFFYNFLYCCINIYKSKKTGRHS